MPPVWLLIHAAGQVLLHRFIPVRQLIEFPWRWVGAVLIVVAAVVVISAAGVFSRRGTTIKPFEESSVLVTDGPWAISRNPIYLMMLVALTGVAIVCGSLTPWLALPSFFAIITTRFIYAEEEMLRGRFGTAYDAYTARVRRWI